MKFKSTAVVLAAFGLVAAAGPALATGNSYDVAVGGSTAAGTHAIEAYTITPSVDFSVENQTSGDTVDMGCDSGYVAPTSGSVVNSGIGITDLAVINGLELDNCIAVGGVAVNVAVDDGMLLHGTGAATAAKTDVVDGHVEGIVAEVRSQIPGLCEFDVTGLADGSYDEAADELTVAEVGFDGSLSIDNVNGCLGAIEDGDPASFETIFAVEDGNGAPRDVNLLP